MIKKHLLIMLVTTTFSLIICLFFPASTFAENESGGQRYNDVCTAPDVSEEFKQSFGCPDAPIEEDLPMITTNIVKNVILICGLVAVVFIIIGGVAYITSSGDGNKTKKAKDTIFYAVIGLIICALAFAIVNWVISSTLKQGTSTEEPIHEETEPTPSFTMNN